MMGVVYSILVPVRKGGDPVELGASDLKLVNLREVLQPMHDAN